MLNTVEIKNNLDVRTLARRYNLQEKKGNQNKKNQLFCCPFHDDNTPSLSVNHDVFHCYSCGAKGDALTLIAHMEGLSLDAEFTSVLAIAAQEAHVPLHLGYVEPHKRVTFVPRTSPKPYTQPTTPRTSGPVMAHLWEHVQALELTDEAHQWCHSRGLDPDIVHHYGARDFAPLLPELHRLIQNTTREELYQSGLINDEGKLWLPLREPERYQGLAIPVFDAKHTHPTKWRWRLYEPDRLKVLGQYGSTQGDYLGLHQAAQANTVIICDGEPDFLSVLDVTQHHQDIAPLALCATTSNHSTQARWLDELTQVQQIILAVHIDRNKQGQAPALGEHPLYGPLAQHLATVDQETFEFALTWRIVDVDGKAEDLNDLHQHHKLSGRLNTWLDTTQEPQENLSYAWQALLKQQRQEHLERELTRAEKHHKQRAKTAFINPMEFVFPSTITEVQPRVNKHIDHAIKHRERLSLAITPGAGKTRHTAHNLALKLHDGEIHTLDWASPSTITSEEAPRAFLDALNELPFSEARETLKQNLRPEVVRNEESCDYFDLYLHASKASPVGGQMMCQMCERGPTRADGEAMCDYWRARQDEDRTQRFITHQKLFLTEGFASDFNAHTRERQVHIKWQEMFALSTSEASVTPYTYNTDHITYLTLREDEQGDAWSNCTTRQALIKRLAEHFGCEPSTEHIKHAVRDQKNTRAQRDVLVIDELPITTMRQSITANLDDLNWMRLEVNMPSSAWHELSQMVEDSKQLDPEDKRRSRRFDGHAIARIFDGIQLDTVDVENLQRDHLEKALICTHEAQHQKRVDILKECHDWRIIAAFLRAYQSGFVECHIQQGKMHMTVLRELDLSRWDTVIALDATLTPELSRLLYGAEVNHVTLDVERPFEHIHVTRIDYDMGKGCAHGDRYRSLKAAKLHKALHLTYDSPGTLHVTHKAWREATDAHDPQASAMLGALQGPVIHFEGSESSGWNGAKDCHTLVLDTYFPNTQAVRSLGATLCMMSGEHWNHPDVRTKWLDEARFLCEGRAYIQIIERIRTLWANEERPVHLIVQSSRSLGDLGFPETYVCDERHVLDANAVIYALTGEATSDGGMLAALRTMLQKHRVWVPSRPHHKETSRQLWRDVILRQDMCMPAPKHPLNHLLDMGVTQNLKNLMISTRADIFRNSALYSNAEVRKKSALLDFIGLFPTSDEASFHTTMLTYLKNRPGGKQVLTQHDHIAVARGYTSGKSAPLDVYYSSHDRTTDILMHVQEHYPDVVRIELDGVMHYLAPEVNHTEELAQLLRGVSLIWEHDRTRPLASHAVHTCLLEHACRMNSPLRDRDLLRDAIKAMGGIHAVRSHWGDRNNLSWCEHRYVFDTCLPVDEDLYARERSTWLKWAMYAPGDVAHWFPPLHVWSLRKRDREPVISLPDVQTLHELLTVPCAGEQLRWMLMRFDVDVPDEHEELPVSIEDVLTEMQSISVVMKDDSVGNPSTWFFNVDKGLLDEPSRMRKSFS